MLYDYLNKKSIPYKKCGKVLVHMLIIRVLTNFMSMCIAAQCLSITSNFSQTKTHNVIKVEMMAV